MKECILQSHSRLQNVETLQMTNVHSVFNVRINKDLEALLCTFVASWQNDIRFGLMYSS